MNLDLTGKTALVTGSTEGIGLGIAKGLAEQGATVIVNGRKQDALDRAIAAVKAHAPGATVTGLAADLATAEGAADIEKVHPHVDILVNNVGVFQPSDFFETGDDVWQRHLDVNVMSGVRLSRAYAPGMVKQGWGRILFIASESAINIPVEMIHYGVTKTANVAVARGLAKRLAGTGVTVNSVLPGPTLSEGVARMLEPVTQKTGQTLEEAAADFVKAHRSSSIIQRAASVEEVANLVVYLASPAASATTGAAMRVDGGVMDTI
jgi:NAD(P)-dependent dehydrogenase (short-subunit alcohol dehydrogenase family)